MSKKQLPCTSLMFVWPYAAFLFWFSSSVKFPWFHFSFFFCDQVTYRAGMTAAGSWKNIFYLHLILTSFMQNFEFLALKITELWLFMYFWELLTAFNSCQNTSLHFPDVCLTLCCLPTCYICAVNSLPQHFPDFIQHHSIA